LTDEGPAEWPQSGPWNNNNNKHDNVYDAVIMAEPLRELKESSHLLGWTSNGLDMHPETDADTETFASPSCHAYKRLKSPFRQQKFKKNLCRHNPSRAILHVGISNNNLPTPTPWVSAASRPSRLWTLTLPTSLF